MMENIFIAFIESIRRFCVYLAQPFKLRLLQ